MSMAEEPWEYLYGYDPDDILTEEDRNMKTTTELYYQDQRVFHLAMKCATEAARRAHPETEGNEMLVHNWGNEQAKTAWTYAWERYYRFDRLYKRAYKEALQKEMLRIA